MTADPKGEPQISSAYISDALTQGIGGKRGLFDSTFPTAAFLVGFVASGSNLTVGIWAAVITGALVMVLRLIRGETLRQVLLGFIGVAISAVFAARTGEAQNFFLPGLLVNLAYGSAFVLSILVRRPLAGYAAGALTGDLTGWMSHPRVRRAAVLASWIWAAAFGLRLAVQLPLYFAGLVGALGVAKIVMGVPLMLLAGFLSYRVMRPVMDELGLVGSADTEVHSDQALAATASDAGSAAGPGAPKPEESGAHPDVSGPESPEGEGRGRGQSHS
ncbi:MAG: DUF3159 domain-containing protein [Actinomycetia bacterium]|nr:DUF3159 domain-containing protein [Actinomycetes bacterium]